MKAKLTSIFNHPDSLDERPFFLILTLILSGMYVSSIVSSAALREPVRLIPFTLLMNVHIALYWAVTWIDRHPRWVYAYLALQGLIAFTIAWMVGSMALIFGLYMGLIGISFGILGRTAKGALAVAYYLGLSLLNYGLEMGWQNLLWWVVGTVPMGAFVLIYVFLYNRQAVARQQAQKLLVELETANRQLSDYASRVEELTIANERQRMARDLHDTLSQGLAGLILQLEAVDAHLKNNRPERARAIVQQTMERARGTLADARRVIDDLRHSPSSSLEESLQVEVERFTNATGIPCQVEISLEQEPSQEACEAVLRAVSEGLTNIARHSRATQARLHIAAGQEGLEVDLYDDGVSFNPDQVQDGHYGLTGIRERARLVGGSFEVDSQPGQGTHLALRLPFG